jgi:hypothetical protein
MPEFIVAKFEKKRTAQEFWGIWQSLNSTGCIDGKMKFRLHVPRGTVTKIIILSGYLQPQM